VNRKDDLAPYYKSKALAEKLAWDFIKNDHSIECVISYFEVKELAANQAPTLYRQ
jgi:hypothetical protein